jgi:hypothetical protein
MGFFGYSAGLSILRDVDLLIDSGAIRESELEREKSNRDVAKDQW